MSVARIAGKKALGAKLQAWPADSPRALFRHRKGLKEFYCKWNEKAGGALFDGSAQGDWRIENKRRGYRQSKRGHKKRWAKQKRRGYSVFMKLFYHSCLKKTRTNYVFFIGLEGCRCFVAESWLQQGESRNQIERKGNSDENKKDGDIPSL